MSLYPTLLSTFLATLSLLSGRVQAAMDPVEIQHSCNSLATSALVLKDLVLFMDSTSNSGPMIVRDPFFLFCPALFLSPSPNYLHATKRKLTSGGLPQGRLQRIRSPV